MNISDDNLIIPWLNTEVVQVGLRIPWILLQDIIFVGQALSTMVGPPVHNKPQHTPNIILYPALNPNPNPNPNLILTVEQLR